MNNIRVGLGTMCHVFASGRELCWGCKVDHSVMLVNSDADVTYTRPLRRPGLVLLICAIQALLPDSRGEA